MKILPLISILCIVDVGGCMHEAPRAVDLDQGRNSEVEMQVVRVFDQSRNARAGVVAAIAQIKDPKKRETITQEFEQNERAWSALIESETLLRQRAKQPDEAPQGFFEHSVEADRAFERIKQYEDWARWITVDEATNPSTAPTPGAVPILPAPEPRQP